MSYRVAAWGLSDKPALPKVEASGQTVESARLTERPVVFDGHAHASPVLDRERLPPGTSIAGPAIVQEAGSSTVVPPGWSVERDSIGCLILRHTKGSVA